MTTSTIDGALGPVRRSPSTSDPVTGRRRSGSGGTPEASRPVSWWRALADVLTGSVVVLLIAVIGAAPIVAIVAPNVATEPFTGLPFGVVLLLLAVPSAIILARLYGRRASNRASEAEPKAGCVWARIADPTAIDR